MLLGVNFVAVRISNQELAPFWGAALRFILASGALFVVMGVRRLPLPQGGALLGAVLFGTLAFGATYALLYWSLLSVSAATAATVFATIPLLTLLIAGAIGLERISRLGLAGAAIVVGGIGVAFADQLGGAVPLVALATTFLAALAGALSGIAVKRFPRSHPVAANAVGMGVGAGLLLLASWIAGEPVALPDLAPTWLALGWLVLSSIVAFVLMVWVLSRWSASATSYAVVLSPLVTVVAGAGLAGERVTPLLLLGALLVLVGVYVGAIRTAPT